MGGTASGGYPVEFYPLARPCSRFASASSHSGWIPAAGAPHARHHRALLAPRRIICGPGPTRWADAGSGVLAVALHIALPGGWYDGGYTELVQWGLITNVAAAYAAFLVLPLLMRLPGDRRRVDWRSRRGTGSVSIYCNPRSLVALTAVGIGVWLTALVHRRERWQRTRLRLALVAVAGGLLSAPEL